MLLIFLIFSVVSLRAPACQAKLEQDAYGIGKFGISALTTCQASCQDQASLREYTKASWSKVLSNPKYRTKWRHLKQLFGGGKELESLADLSTDQVKHLFQKLGIDTSSPFLNTQMQGIYADTFYGEQQYLAQPLPSFGSSRKIFLQLLFSLFLSFFLTSLPALSLPDPP